MQALRARLAAEGVKRKFLNEVVLPSWWDDSIANTPAGFREGAGYICAHLGYSLASLLNEHSNLSFASQPGVRFKKRQKASVEDVCLVTNYALGCARAAASGFTKCEPQAVPSPGQWRHALLGKSDRPWVSLKHLLAATWELGIIVIHLRNLPSGPKRPDALTTMVGERPVILILNGRKSPSWIAFIVAHELGHIHHQHLKPGQTLVDEKIAGQAEDDDEVAANEFAAILLTGQPDLGFHSTRRPTAVQLAQQVRRFGNTYQVAPGVAALNYGFTTGFWPVAMGALNILEEGEDAAIDLREALDRNLCSDDFSENAWEFLSRATATVE